MKPSFLQRFETHRPFTEREAWNIFRIAALAEAFGWTLLITGIVWNKTTLPGHKIAIPIAGNIHGSIFIIYFVVLLATYSSLGWSRLNFVVAAAAGVPPYGSLIFELVASVRRRKKLGSATYRVEVRAIIMTKQGILAVQPVEGVRWQLPGGEVLGRRNPEQALQTALFELTGVTPRFGGLQSVEQQQNGRVQRLIFYFTALNPEDFSGSALKVAKASAGVDDAKFISLSEVEIDFPATLLAAPQSIKNSKVDFYVK